ncbi:MAG: MaoC family dehydratase [Thermodesulfovibrionales bacterium]|nr:MaoC family dehydratase [Thermodesulfovibrionales bacterium]
MMAVKEITSVEELLSLVGKEVSITDWLEITQDRINKFADVSGDYQWIHIDVERAKRESPYRTTIAHGFLTLSLLTLLESQAIKLKMPYKMRINYGLNKVRFPAPVPAGSKIRASLKLIAVEEISKGLQLIWNVSIEREGSAKPCCVAEWILRYYE